MRLIINKKKKNAICKPTKTTKRVMYADYLRHAQAHSRVILLKYFIVKTITQSNNMKISPLATYDRIGFIRLTRAILQNKPCSDMTAICGRDYIRDNSLNTLEKCMVEYRKLTRLYYHPPRHFTR